MILKPCILGVGYVGLPLYIQLQKNFNVVGYDIDKNRINSLKKGIDFNKEHSFKEICLNKNSFFTNKVSDIKECNFYILCVPTPVTKTNVPDLRALKQSCIKLSGVIKKNDIVIVESTVFPGVTEDFCSKFLSKKNNLTPFNDFFIGYSPERINPGDKKHSVNKIKKIISINTNKKEVKNNIFKVYKKISKGIIFSKDIKATETAKVLENIQRDLNIALINEIFIFCKKLNLNFKEVIRLASTKWNFLKFEPGLVGGHCLPVDPYYLSYIAKKNNVNLSVVLAGRKTNNEMQNFAKSYLVKKLLNNKIKVNDRIIIAGITYKSNVADIRNSIALKVAILLKKKFKNITIYDPYIKKFNIKNLDKKIKDVKSLIILTRHEIFKSLIKLAKKEKVKIIQIFND